MPVLNRIAEFAEDMTSWRRHLHSIPELKYDLEETEAFVAARLADFGVDEIHRGIAQTGIVALIAGQGDGPVIGLRADMDALPIEEKASLPYKSTKPGNMHACGHDGHMTMLLGAARYLAETRNFAGTVALIFQPAEEGGAGGKAMVDAGTMDRFGIERVFAVHNWPGLDLGKIDMNYGPTMAAADQFDIHLKVNGAHAAWPHQSVDPIVVGAQIVSALQSLVSRTVAPADEAVVSVTQFTAGTTHNVIPGHALLRGTTRTMRAEVRQMIAERLQSIVRGIAEGMGAEVKIDYRFGYPATVNEDSATDLALIAARDVVGEAHATLDHLPQMGAEDFAFMLEARPGAYVYIGVGDIPGLHHPDYNFPDEAAPIGASYFARLVETIQPVARG